MATGAYGLTGGRGDALWNRAPITELLRAPQNFVYYWDDFLTFDDEASAGETWVSTQASAGTAALGDAIGGILVLDCNSTTQGQGMQTQLSSESFILAAGREMWYECRFKVADLVSGAQIFVGLAEYDTSIIASNEMSTANHIGFGMTATTQSANAGKMYFLTEKATSAGQVASVKTLAEDTYTRLGFYARDLNYVELYVDGDLFATKFTDTDDIPIVEMAPAFVCQNNDGTTDPILTVDWVRILQTR